MKTKVFIFDLDGVIVDTAKYHYLAWKKLANNLNIDFTHEHNELLKGVSRVRSLEIILGLGNVEASDEQVRMTAQNVAKFLSGMVPDTTINKNKF